MEVKELARATLPTIQKGRFPALVSNMYPPHEYRKEQGSIHIVSSGLSSERIEFFKVYVVNPNTTNGIAKGLYHPIYSNTVDALQQINNSAGPWYTNQGKPGIPSSGDLNTAHRILQDYENKDPQQAVQWDQLVPYLFTAKSTTDGPHNLIELPKYFQDTIVPEFTPSILLTQGDVPSSGTLDLADLPKGDIDVIAGCKTDKGFYVWARSITIKPKSATQVDLSPSNAPFKLHL
jgi:hypothetical protein